MKIKKNYKFIIRLISLVFFFLPLMSVANDSRRKPESRNQFIKTASQVRECTDLLAEISSKLQSIQRELKNNKVCNKNLSTLSKIDECANYKRSFFEKIKTLESKANDIENQECSGHKKPNFYLFDVLGFQQRRDIDTLRKIQLEITTSRARLNIFLSYFDSLKTSLLDERQYSLNRASIFKRCYKDYKSNRLLELEYSSQIFKGTKLGDWYQMTNNLHKMSISYQYSKTLFDTCGFNREGSDFTEKELHIKKRFSDSLSDDLEVLEDYKNVYQNKDLKEMALKMCTNLMEKNKDDFGICESPKTNDSWFYSAHYLLNRE